MNRAPNTIWDGAESHERKNDMIDLKLFSHDDLTNRLLMDLDDESLIKANSARKELTRRLDRLTEADGIIRELVDYPDIVEMYGLIRDEVYIQCKHCGRAYPREKPECANPECPAVKARAWRIR